VKSLLFIGALGLLGFGGVKATSAMSSGESKKPDIECATCTGSDSCTACKNCHSCKYCSSGGKCGVCRK